MQEDGRKKGRKARREGNIEKGGRRIEREKEEKKGVNSKRRRKEGKKKGVKGIRETVKRRKK